MRVRLSVAALLLACSRTCVCMRLVPAPILPSRRSCLKGAAALAAVQAGAPLVATQLLMVHRRDGAQTLALLKEARAQLDACDGLTADGSWDAVPLLLTRGFPSAQLTHMSVLRCYTQPATLPGPHQGWSASAG